MNFKPNANVFSDDPYYDLFDGGRIKPEELLADEADVKKVKDAMSIVSTFMAELEEKEVLEVG